MSNIPVLEIFGPTIQGEGMAIGKKTMFVRTAGCDYSCDWCDSAYTWDGSAKDDIVLMTGEEIWQRLKDIGQNRFSHVTISGGNPALIKGLSQLITILKENQMSIGLETQGSRWQDWFLQIDDLTLSPKPPSSMMETDFKILHDVIVKLIDHDKEENVSLKVVVFNDGDYEYAKNLALKYPSIPFYLQVGNEEVYTEDNESLAINLLKKYEWLIDKVVSDQDVNNVRVLPQLHTLLWGNKRGV
ncbi:7-carboxy-7-deazaguanine synthase QueE [Evansella sp. AB-P1]|uniref:7-carboxy-7-deazaguanine synthase QueE n=1 Tax=Evansella sp. AB-P1 TaxID=3037653 RepID=UPI00241ED9B7|nr:7-carboxy-7-deazaguanine synthase QueE [Evansella sp. AB-P1]MDG5790040.1 7-carboxy-7-deazaguanine synthase QueE [Evansella sp. AB-P1]